MITPSPHRNRRLRKKLHIAEFQELGFPVEFRFAPSLTEEQRDAFWDSFLVEAIEANSLMFGGGESGYICAVGRKSCTDFHRDQVQSWLSARQEVLNFNVGVFDDVWYGSLIVAC